MGQVDGWSVRCPPTPSDHYTPVIKHGNPLQCPRLPPPLSKGPSVKAARGRGVAGTDLAHGREVGSAGLGEGLADVAGSPPTQLSPGPRLLSRARPGGGQDAGSHILAGSRGGLCRPRAFGGALGSNGLLGLPWAPGPTHCC